MQTLFPYLVFFPFLKYFTGGSTALVAGAQLCPAVGPLGAVGMAVSSTGQPLVLATAAAPAHLAPPAPKP